MKTGLFSIIRYVPDAFRKEFLNVGALVAFPDEGIIEFKLQYGTSKLSAIDRSFNPDTLTLFQNNLSKILAPHADVSLEKSNAIHVETDKIKDEARLKNLLKPFVGARVQFSDFYTTEFEAEEISEFEISSFLIDIINGYVSSKKRTGVIKDKEEQSFKEEVAGFFAKEKLLSKKQERNKIQKNGVLPGLHWKFDFVFQNGAYNLIETLDLKNYPRGTGANVIGESGKIMAKFGAAKKLKENEVNPLTIVRGIESADDDARLQIDVLKDHSKIIEVKLHADMPKVLQAIHVSPLRGNLLME